MAVIVNLEEERERARKSALEALQRDFGQHVVWNTLLPVGAPRRDWRKTLVSDGFIMLRHPDLAAMLEMADRVGAELELYAG